MRNLLSFLFCFPQALFAQKIQFHPGDSVICYLSYHIENTSVSSNIDLRSRVDNKSNSTILVTYNGFTPEAQSAFQYAVDIWARTITSEVPIRITANWSQLGKTS